VDHERAAVRQDQREHVVEEQVLLGVGGQGPIERDDPEGVVDLHQRQADELDDEPVGSGPVPAPCGLVTPASFDGRAGGRRDGGDGADPELSRGARGRRTPLRDPQAPRADGQGLEQHR
jgi:hypothetical protein